MRRTIAACATSFTLLGAIVAAPSVFADDNPIATSVQQPADGTKRGHALLKSGKFGGRTGHWRAWAPAVTQTDTPVSTPQASNDSSASSTDASPAATEPTQADAASESQPAQESTGGNDSGDSAPTGSSPGFSFVASEDFDTAAAAGTVAIPFEGGDRQASYAYDDLIVAYGDWQGNDGGTYRFQENVSVADGMLNADLGMIDGEATGSAWIFKFPGAESGSFTYGAVEQRVRVVGNVPSYGSAGILWPASDEWGEGEIDFPEGNFASSPSVFHHCLGDRAPENCSWFDTGLADWSQWHTYRIEWTPQGTSYFIDGTLLGTNTDATPTTPHNWVTQMALHPNGETTPLAEQSGTYQVDWIRFEAYTG
ncbi:MAG: glycoside hydrolase family 16 protein [Arachnia sp.]